MAKLGEIQYLRNIGESACLQAINKPFSDPRCPLYLDNLSAILQLMPPPPGRLLDLGCGTGWTSDFFARVGYDVVGTDISSDMIEAAERRRDQAGLTHLRFVEADYESLPFQEEFDLAVFYDSLHHAVDERMALESAFRALRPGGLCVTQEPGDGHADSDDAIDAVRRYGVTEKDMPPETIVSLARAIGFNQSYVFPLPQVNRVISYELDDSCRVQGHGAATRIGPVHAPKVGWLKRMLHHLVRRHYGFSQAAFAVFMRGLPRLAVACHRLSWAAPHRHGGLVVLIK